MMLEARRGVCVVVLDGDIVVVWCCIVDLERIALGFNEEESDYVRFAQDYFRVFNGTLVSAFQVVPINNAFGCGVLR